MNQDMTVMASILIVFVYTCGLYVRRVFQEKHENKPIEMLKNALLTLAMSRVYQAKGLFDNLNSNYKSFDGTKLPMMSGFDAENACFSYIQNPEQVARGPWASQQMIDKAIAIQKFIKTNLSTEKAVVSLFADYMELNNTINDEEEKEEEEEEEEEEASASL
jgi:hypothetical protein